MERVKFISDIDDMDNYISASNGIHDRAINDVLHKFTRRFNEIFLEGLKRHGFIFFSVEEAIPFVKEHCEVRSYGNGKYFFAKGIPFLLHIHSGLDMVKPKISDEEVSMECTSEFYFI